jgi:hypothetical protein
MSKGRLAMEKAIRTLVFPPNEMWVMDRQEASSVLTPNASDFVLRSADRGRLPFGASAKDCLFKF